MKKANKINFFFKRKVFKVFSSLPYIFLLFFHICFNNNCLRVERKVEEMTKSFFLNLSIATKLQFHIWFIVIFEVVAFSFPFLRSFLSYYYFAEQKEIAGRAKICVFFFFFWLTNWKFICSVAKSDYGSKFVEKCYHLTSCNKDNALVS